MANGKSADVLAGDYGVANNPKGVVLAVAATYTVPSSGGPGIGEKVEMVPVPKGAKILNVKTAGPAGTASMTAVVGDGGSTSRFNTTITASAAFCKDIEVGTGVGYEYTEDDTIDITFGVAAPTATHVYRMVVTYTLD